MRLRWALFPLSVHHLSACGEPCGADAAVDGVHVTAMDQPEPRDIVTVVVDGDEITITWTLEDGSTRDVVYTTGEFSTSFP